MSKFSKQHYELIAAQIKEAAHRSIDAGLSLSSLGLLAGQTAEMFRLDNPNFRTRQFYEAAGIDASGPALTFKL